MDVESAFGRTADAMDSSEFTSYMQHCLISLVALLVFRTILTLYRIRNAGDLSKAKRPRPVKLMIVLGSGGHTFEMLKLVENISPGAYSPRIYVTATSDTMSAEKAKQLEMWRVASSSQVLLLRFLSSKKDASDSPEMEEPSDYIVERIPRCRELHQSWITTVPTTLYAIFRTLPVLFRHLPDVIVCNGPGTCFPIVLVSFVFAVFGIKKMVLIYVESFCRVKTLSLTGRLLYHFVDHFVVQWPQLTTKYTRAIYHGLLV